MYEHYYAGSERIASSIGGNALPYETVVDIDEEKQSMVNMLFERTLTEYVENINYELPDSIETSFSGSDEIKTYEYWEIKGTSDWLDQQYSAGGVSNSSPPIGEADAERETAVSDENIMPHLVISDFYKEDNIIESFLYNSSIENPVYEGVFYAHSDHIGSASWVTTGDWYNGIKLIQHMQYLPWGELWMDQRATEYNERFTFSGKEKDEETGLHYFGFRYLNSMMSIWTGVDPLSDKYPSTSSYAYCNNNPIMLRDPDGRKWENAAEGKKLRDGVSRKINRFNEKIETAKDRIEVYKGKEQNSYNKRLIKCQENRVKDYENRISYLNRTLKDIDDIAAHHDIFRLGGSNIDGTNYVKKGSDGVITIQGDCIAIWAHEMRHVGQAFEDGGMQFDNNNCLTYPKNKRIDYEIEAYKIQFILKFNSLPSAIENNPPARMKDINSDYIKSIINYNNNEKIYDD